MEYDKILKMKKDGGVRMGTESAWAPVALRRADTYEYERLLACLEQMGADLGLAPAHFRGRRVVIKPNLVAAMRPEQAATSDPTLLSAVAAFLRAHGAGEILVAESPSGIYSETMLRRNYRACGILEAAEAAGVTLNYATDAVSCAYHEGVACRAFSVIAPIAEADVIVDLCRLKSHSLTRLSGAVKNLFGVVPGVEKFEMHSAYPTMPIFSEMLVDLCAMLCGAHEVLAICDAVTAMEGNGPTGGAPRRIGALLMSASPFCLDRAAEALIGFEGTVPTTEIAAGRGLCPPRADALRILGEPLAALTVADFAEPDSSRETAGVRFLRALPDFMGGRFARFLRPRPQIDAKACVGCGVCAASCPRHRIALVGEGAKRRARIDYDGCICCFCCQELCPHRAVRIRKNPFLSLVH